MITLYADRWILQSLAGEREVGMYVALYQIANAPIVLTIGIINQFFVPIIFDAAGDMRTLDQRDQSSRMVDISVVIGAACGAAGLYLLAVVWVNGRLQRELVR